MKEVGGWKGWAEVNMWQQMLPREGADQGRGMSWQCRGRCCKAEASGPGDEAL